MLSTTAAISRSEDVTPVMTTNCYASITPCSSASGKFPKLSSSGGRKEPPPPYSYPSGESVNVHATSSATGRQCPATVGPCPCRQPEIALVDRSIVGRQHCSSSRSTQSKLSFTPQKRDIDTTPPQYPALNNNTAEGPQIRRQISPPSAASTSSTCNFKENND